MMTNQNQRWSERRTRFRSDGERINPSEYEVAAMTGDVNGPAANPGGAVRVAALDVDDGTYAKGVRDDPDSAGHNARPIEAKSAAGLEHAAHLSIKG